MKFAFLLKINILLNSFYCLSYLKTKLHVSITEKLEQLWMRKFQCLLFMLKYQHIFTSIIYLLLNNFHQTIFVTIIYLLLNHFHDCIFKESSDNYNVNIVIARWKEKNQNKYYRARVVTLILVFVNIYQILRPITLTKYMLITSQYLAWNYCLIDSEINTLMTLLWWISMLHVFKV